MPADTETIGHLLMRSGHLSAETWAQVVDHWLDTLRIRLEPDGVCVYSPDHDVLSVHTWPDIVAITVALWTISAHPDDLQDQTYVKAAVVKELRQLADFFEGISLEQAAAAREQ